MRRVQVGLIGANADHGWSARSHLPALQSLESVELAAVATSRIETARVTADRYGARRAYAGAEGLIADPDVELVVVTVRVARHYDLVRAALEAGKDVLCEWPLACGTTESEDLLDRAQRLNRRHFIGLQAAVSPEVRLAAEMITNGTIGTLEVVTVRVASATGGTPFPADGRYLFEPDVGTSLLSIQLAHTLAGVTKLIGPLVSASGLNRTRYPQVELLETGERVEAPFSDHAAIVAATEDDILVTMNVATGVPRNPGTVIEVTGSAGTLRLESPGPLQYTRTRILIGTDPDPRNLTECPVPPAYQRAPAELADRAAIGVGELYLAVADDLGGDGGTAPTFADAVNTHRLLDAAGITTRGARSRET